MTEEVQEGIITTTNPVFGAVREQIWKIVRVCRVVQAQVQRREFKEKIMAIILLVPAAVRAAIWKTATIPIHPVSAVVREQMLKIALVRRGLQAQVLIGEVKEAITTPILLVHAAVGK